MRHIQWGRAKATQMTKTKPRDKHHGAYENIRDTAMLSKNAALRVVRKPQGETA